jgi:anti-sigma regulatory factor (Ser/Thr protein kinase)
MKIPGFSRPEGGGDFVEDTGGAHGARAETPAEALVEASGQESAVEDAFPEDAPAGGLDTAIESLPGDALDFGDDPGPVGEQGPAGGGAPPGNPGPLAVEVGGDLWRLVLRPRADAPRLARDFVADACRKWRTPWWDASGTLITSELVTNGVRHARTPVVLRLERRPDGLVISVDDEAGGRPRIVPAEERSSGGRGLAIVEQLSAEWGVTTRTGGKTVWARLAPPPAAADEDDGPDVDESDIPAKETVVLELPWGKDLVVVARSAAGHLGARAGFTRQEVEDLRLAVDEACGLLILRAMNSKNPKKKSEIQCRFTVTPGAVEFAVSAPVPDGSAPPMDDFGWNLLEALVDEAEWTDGNRTCGVRGLKRSGHAGQKGEAR